MAVDIGPKIGIDGEAEFRKALNNITQQLKTLGSEMNAVTSAFTDETKAQEKSSKTSAILSKEIAAQRDSLCEIVGKRVDGQLCYAVVALVDAHEMLAFHLGGERKAERVIVVGFYGEIGVVPFGKTPCRTRVEPLYRDFIFSREYKARAQTTYRDRNRRANREYLWVNIIIV